MADTPHRLPLNRLKKRVVTQQRKSLTGWGDFYFTWTESPLRLLSKFTCWLDELFFVSTKAKRCENDGEGRTVHSCHYVSDKKNYLDSQTCHNIKSYNKRIKRTTCRWLILLAICCSLRGIKHFRMSLESHIISPHRWSFLYNRTHFIPYLSTTNNS